MRTVFLPVVLILSLIACKKKDNIVDNIPDPGSSPTGVFKLDNCYGKISFEEYIKLGAGSSGLSRFPIKGIFTNSPLSVNGAKNLDVGTITVNGIVLKKVDGAMGSKSYSDSTGTLFSLKEFTLASTGTPEVAPFNLKYTGGSPALNDTSGIPSVYNQSEGIHLKFKDIVDADSLVFLITRDNYFQLRKQISTTGKTEAKVDIERAELTAFMDNHLEASISIIVFKKVLLRSGLRDYFVFSQKTYYKDVFVKLF